MFCQYVFKRGKNCGNKCESKPKSNEELCSKHLKNKEQTIIEQNGTRITDIPNDCLLILISSIAKHTVRANIKSPNNAAKALVNLAMSNKTFYNLIDDNIWNIAWNTYKELHDTNNGNNTMQSKDKILLYALTGCQFCKAPRIRKVYEEFGVRCCKECLYERTISDYRLKTDFGINLNQLSNLPFTTADLYSRYNGSYSLDFYWIEDVEKMFGRTLLSLANDKLTRQANTNNENLKVLINDKLPFDYAYVIENTKFTIENNKNPTNIKPYLYIEDAKKCYIKHKIDNWLKEKTKNISKNDINKIKKADIFLSLYKLPITTNFEATNMDRYWSEINEEIRTSKL
jgi:hypothetical protein